MSFEQLFQQAEQARAYIRITQEQGPSEQLLDFINYDGNLYTDLGLESLGLETMSLITRHEIMVSKLNPEHLEEMAMEGLGDFVKKYRRSLLVSSFFLGFTFLPAVAGYIISRGEGTFPTYQETDAVYRRVEKLKASVESITNKIPSSFDEDKWTVLSDEIETILDKAAGDTVDEKDEVLIDRGSGWTPDNYKSLAVATEKLCDELESFGKKIAAKLDPAEKFVGSSQEDDKAKVAKAVGKALSKYEKLTSVLKKDQSRLVRTMQSLSKSFKPKK
jgi:hypothetical protein